MKTKTPTTSLTASLEAVRAAAKAHSTQLAALAAQPAPAAPAPAPKAPPKLQQYNVRLTPEARARLRSAAAMCQMSDQDFIERWAMTLPAPAPAPAMPWESPN